MQNKQITKIKDLADNLAYFDFETIIIDFYFILIIM